jgi:hypothetical protein
VYVIVSVCDGGHVVDVYNSVVVTMAVEVTETE